VPEVTEVAEIVIALNPLFVRVTFESGLVAPTTTLPKPIEAGVSVVATMPVPVRATVVGVAEALVEIDSELAGTAPAAVGVSVSEITQLEFPASDAPHVVDATAYSAGGVIELIVNGDAPRLFSETDLIGLVVPTTTLPKAIEVADTETVETPVPVKAAVSGLLVAVVVTVSEEAGTAPRAVGVNVIEILHDPPEAAIGVEVEQVVDGSNA